MEVIPGAPWTKFYAVENGTPEEGALVLVRLRDNTYRFGMVLQGHFANYAYHTGEYVTLPHPERISHFMVVTPPVDSPAKAEGETPEAEGSAPVFEEQPQDLAEDVYR